MRWPTSFNGFSRDEMRRMAFLSLACLAIGLFIKVTWELYEDSELNNLDNTILSLVGRLRFSSLNGPAVDVTALGSPTVILLICCSAIVVLCLARQRWEAVFLVLSAGGAGILGLIVKSLIHRDRPTIIPRLVEVTDFSYPSDVLSGMLLGTAWALGLAAFFFSRKVEGILR